MLTQLEALVALSDHRTMTAAATALRVTQSAVSKRVAALEAQLGRRLVEPDGRRVRLTSDGALLVARVRPLLGALAEVVQRETEVRAGRLVIGVSESILASWGADALVRLRERLPGLELSVHAHRSPVAIEHVRAGAYSCALVAGEGDHGSDLTGEVVAEEEMVVVPSGLRRRDVPRVGLLPVLSIEDGAATARSLARRFGRLEREAGLTVEVTTTVESYAALVQMSRAGFGHGLAPCGVARALGVTARSFVRLPAPGLSRPIRFVARATTFAQPLVCAVRDRLRAAARAATR
jgi:DNA-binding transcriptional LysR family regulator